MRDCPRNMLELAGLVERAMRISRGRLHPGAEEAMGARRVCTKLVTEYAEAVADLWFQLCPCFHIYHWFPKQAVTCS